MAKNGSIKYIGVALTLLALVGSAIYGYATLGHQVEDNTKMQPDVKQNTEHRIKFEEKVSNIEKNVGLILDEVKKIPK